jgi:acyl-CoA synthetase (AMP-forming)/AMP-acid ligase II
MTTKGDTPRTLHGVLGRAVTTAAENHPGRVAVADPDRSITWGRLRDAATTLCGPLTARGVRQGDIVALSMHSGVGWVVAATAVNLIGGTIAGISPVVTATERAAMVNLLGARLVLADADLIEGLPLRTDVAEFSHDGLGLRDESQPHVDLASDPMGLNDTEGAFAVCFTSGTTGTPKAALFSGAAAEAVCRIDLGENPVAGSGGHMISSTQFAHVGFVLKLPGYALLGSTIHVMDRWNAAGAIRLAAEHRMSTLGVVAPQLALMLRSPELDSADLSVLHTVIAGGAASPEALIAEARKRLGVTYSVRWSSTESGGVGLAATIDDEHLDAIGSIGMPRPGVSARVADADARELPLGEVGELQVRSAAMMNGYLGDAEATAEAFTSDGWLRTGDLATVRPDGRFVLSGRSSDMYIRGGYNVHPQEVEAALGTHPSVAELAVVPRSDDVMGQIGVAVVVPNAGHDLPTLADLRAHAAESLARHKLPEDVVGRNSLPLTPGGKLDRALLREEVGR